MTNSKSSTVAGWPADRSSRTTTSWPAAPRALQVCDPMYPAPPVTSSFAISPPTTNETATTVEIRTPSVVMVGMCAAAMLGSRELMNAETGVRQRCHDDPIRLPIRPTFGPSPRSSGDRAVASGAMSAGSNPAEGASRHRPCVPQHCK